jgi:hypothetical protein
LQTSTDRLQRWARAILPARTGQQRRIARVEGPERRKGRGCRRARVWRLVRGRLGSSTRPRWRKRCVRERECVCVCKRARVCVCVRVSECVRVHYMEKREKEMGLRCCRHRAPSLTFSHALPRPPCAGGCLNERHHGRGLWRGCRYAVEGKHSRGRRWEGEWGWRSRARGRGRRRGGAQLG